MELPAPCAGDCIQTIVKGCHACRDGTCWWCNCLEVSGCPCKLHKRDWMHPPVYPREPSDLLFIQLKGFHCVYSLCTACVPWDPSTPGFNIRLAHPHSCSLWFILLCTEKTKVFLLFFQILRTRFQWMKSWPQILITSLSCWLNETESPPHKISLCHQIAKRYREEELPLGHMPFLVSPVQELSF